MINTRNVLFNLDTSKTEIRTILRTRVLSSSGIHRSVIFVCARRVAFGVQLRFRVVDYGHPILVLGHRGITSSMHDRVLLSEVLPIQFQ